MSENVALSGSSGGRCRAAELQRALSELPERRLKATERLEGCREAKKRAREALKEASRRLAACLRRWKAAEQENDCGGKLDEGKMLKELEILHGNAKESQVFSGFFISLTPAFRIF